MNKRVALNAAHPEYLGFQIDWPVFVKAPVLRVGGRVYKKNDVLPWAQLGVDPAKVAQLYRRKYIIHDNTRAVEESLGDRLGEMSQKNLHRLATLMNDHFKKKHCATAQEFKQKRCRASNNEETQRRYIRQFLYKNPSMSDFFLENREHFITKVIETPQEDTPEVNTEVSQEETPEVNPEVTQEETPEVTQEDTPEKV